MHITNEDTMCICKNVNIIFKPIKKILFFRTIEIENVQSYL